MPIIVEAASVAESYLDLVNNIRDECGLTSPVLTTLSGADQRVRNIMGYLNFTVEDIWNADRAWPFAQASGTITLVADQQAYEMEDDFDRIHSDPKYAQGQLRHIGSDKLDRAVPDQSGSGTPTHYSMWSGEFLLHSRPSSDFISDYPTLSYKYWRRPVPMANDGDYPDIPDKYTELLKVGARARFKEYLESPDAQIDYALYGALMSRLRRNKRQIQGPKAARWRR